MFRASILIASLLVAASTTLSAADLSDDAREMESTRKQFESSCRVNLREKLSQRSSSPAPASIAKWVSEIADPEEYCSCATAGFFDGLDPSFLRSGTARQGAVRAKWAGTRCVLPKLKASFPRFCREMVREITPSELRSSDGEELSQQMCACTQPAIDALTVDSFEAFAAASIRDYAEYQRSRVLPTAGMSSLIAQMNACGLGELRKRLDRRK
jgi:hypothetical protein